MAAPVRFNHGITNREKTEPMGMLPVLDPTTMHVYFNDFDHYTAADWTITTTEAGTGDATEALLDTNGDGGVLVLTNDNADNDNDFLQKKGESFKIGVSAGKKIWFKSRFKVSDATQSDFIMGLQITDTTPLAVTDGIYFHKEDGDANLDFVLMKDSAYTDATAIHTMVDDTWVVVGFYYDGVDSVKYYVDDVHIGTSVTTYLPDDEELTVSFGIQNGVAAAKIMSIDYVFAAKER